MRNVDILMGLQYGSEGKGLVAGALALQKMYANYVRIGGSQAGHSFNYQGKHYVFRHIPCGVIADEVNLLFAKGSMLDPDVMLKEISDNGMQGRHLYIDPLAYPILPEDGVAEQNLKARIGSTGKGNGQALIQRIRRGKHEFSKRKRYFKNKMWHQNISYEPIDPFFNQGYTLVESTQGYELSLMSNHYPFVTGRNIGVGTIIDEAGIPFNSVRKVLGIARTYPIRVAGNSGPMGVETSWEAISIKLGYKVREETTVTKKVRRVAEFNKEMLGRAIEYNGVSHLFLTFMDYLDPKAKNAKCYDELPAVCKEFVCEMRESLKVHILGVSNGPDIEKNVFWIDKEYFMEEDRYYTHGV